MYLMCSFQVFCQPFCLPFQTGLVCVVFELGPEAFFGCKSVQRRSTLKFSLAFVAITWRRTQHRSTWKWCVFACKIVSKTNYKFKTNFWPFIKLHTNLCKVQSFTFCQPFIRSILGICTLPLGPCVTMQLSASAQSNAFEQKPSIMTN